MSRNRQQPHPWLAEHVIFFGYRWLAWLVALALVMWRGDLVRYGALLVVAGLINLLSTIVAQPYVRAAQRNPVVMSLDLLCMVPMVLSTTGWNWPFIPYALSSLVVPGLLFGWRGGLMAGLSFASLSLAGGYALGRTPVEIIGDGGWLGWGELLLIMAGPPLFGMSIGRVISLLAQFLEYRRHRRGAPPPTAGDQRVAPSAPPDLADPYARLRSREAEPGRAARGEETALATRTAAVRATDHSTEEMRRVMFAPLPTIDMELPALLDQLTARFGQQTGLATRVTVLGRARRIQQAQRLVLLRLAQEALLNVQQHAHAQSIELTLRYDATSIALMIQDNGVGLLDGTYERPGLHALRAMHYRLAEFGGRLDVFETERSGVTVRATMPLD